MALNEGAPRMTPPEKPLRNGYTTGTTATLAAMAAMHLLMTGVAPERMAVPLPPFEVAEERSFPAGWLELPLACAGYGAAPGLEIAGGGLMAHAGAIKDAGDDPDITDGMMIFATLASRSANTNANAPFLTIRGGPGIGIATAPGLPVPVGEAAINPAPRAQILWALCNLHANLSRSGKIAQPPFEVAISAPEGEKRAEKTLNGRLGIKGGISILGTHGIVRPYSHSAFKKSISRQIEFAVQNGMETVCLATGRRSESLLMRHFPSLQSAAFIQAADLAQFTLSLCGQRFRHIIWGCFFGKLLKLAMGLGNIHAHEQAQNTALLVQKARLRGMKCADALALSPTAQGCLEILLAEADGMKIIDDIFQLASSCVEKFAGTPVRIFLFNTDGAVLKAS